MFTPFFYLLRAKGIDVSNTQWLTLMQALDKGLCGASLTNFYYLARMIVVTTETDFDKYDKAFLEYFKGVQAKNALPEQFKQWLQTADDDIERFIKPADDYNYLMQNKPDREKKKVEEMFRERKAQQNTRHDGGNQWIGTGGTSAFGHSGKAPGGIRMSGKTGMQSAFAVIGEERYRDWRIDKALSYRQFQAAFRRLRQYSGRLDIPKTELDLEATVDKTCENGGYLSIEYMQPRKNTVKLLLLFDSGGTMIPYMQLCNNLFKAVDKANHFKDVKTYYFHNCIYSHVYKTPECEDGDWVKSEWLFRNLDADYKVVIVGDMQMAPEELYDVDGNYRGPNEGLSGFEWLSLYKKHFKRIVWLNPAKHDYAKLMDWMQAEAAIQDMFPTYKLSVKGLNDAIKKLMNPAAQVY
ncbi:MAG: VWA containing CoxE family protein [Lachnospiraceae bacterium]|nr:VWA containing CoxE family protein [Lachnospiraceae bacterium]